MDQEATKTMPTQDSLQIEIVDGQKILLDQRIIQVSTLIAQQLIENPAEPLRFIDLDLDQLQFVQLYLSLHDYDLSASKTKQEITSSFISDHFQSKIDMQLFEGLSVQKISQYLRVAVYLQIEQLKQLCQVALGTKLYVGYDEQSLQILREVHDFDYLTDDDVIDMKIKYPWAYMTCAQQTQNNCNNNFEINQQPLGNQKSNNKNINNDMDLE